MTRYFVCGTVLWCCGLLPAFALADQQRSRTTPTAEELLTTPSYADPERVDELIKRSQRRPVDRFDLPPAGGGAVLPVGMGEPVTNETGPADPE